MKKYIYTLAAVSCAMLASCSKDAGFDNQALQSQAITEISASSDPETRAAVDGTDNTKINWESGDALKVFGLNSSSTAADADYTLSSAAGKTSGTFINAESTVSTIQACMYPAQSTAIWSGGKLTCSIPSVQTAVAGSFDKSAAVMYSIGSSAAVTLSSAVAFLKVTVGASETNVHAITIYNSTALSGNIGITSSGVAAAGTGSETYVTLQADAGNGALAAGTYYIAVLPGTYDNLSIAYKYTDHTAKAKAKASSTRLTIQAGHVKVITADFTTGTVHDAIQLWSDGPYFATMNLGETTVSGNTQTYTYTDANGTGSNSVVGLWGYAWRVPTKDELDGLVGMAGTLKVSAYSYTTESYVYGFKFTPKESGYAGSLFLPADDDGSANGGVGEYWSSTVDGSNAWCLALYYNRGDDASSWDSNDQSGDGYYVRPVLR